MQLPCINKLWQLSCLHSVWEETNKGQMKYCRQSPFVLWRMNQCYSFKMCIYCKSYFSNTLFPFLKQTLNSHRQARRQCLTDLRTQLPLNICALLCLIVCEQNCVYCTWDQRVWFQSAREKFTCWAPLSFMIHVESHFEGNQTRNAMHMKCRDY